MSGGPFAPLIEGAQVLGMTLDAAQLDLFDRFRRELLDWNTRVNLTAITDPDLVLTRHFLDSLTVVAALSPRERQRPLRVIDVGAGAGLPGLALQIALPHWRVTELDSVAKKTRFVSHIVDVLGLAGATALTGRAEDLGRDPQYRERYDLCLARGVAPLRVLAEYTLPFCRVGGCLIAMKKGEIELELAEGRRAAGQLGARVGRVVRVPPLPDLGEDRVLLRCDKIRPTPPELPRAAGLPARRPL
ncbi:MAG TPA: 16S rRNA (guanine(527)-N(7))-methyltransferase RsmG [Chloroflexota bacterium]|nr:16S rRNA (guanine(527)-N(7))-methyltransferase RsmG [Chloroflexota bacterium]